MNDKRVLELLTRKFAEEISLEEKKELDVLFEKNPDIVYYEQFLKEIWQERNDKRNLETNIDNQYKKHKLRYNKHLKFSENDEVNNKNEETNSNSIYLKYAFVLGIFIVLGILFFKWDST